CRQSESSAASDVYKEQVGCRPAAGTTGTSPALSIGVIADIVDDAGILIGRLRQSTLCGVF
ncbi:hypothetical protein, partial [Stenotrophomonas maltophilia]|uniref:hypothetical protein n=1 Tax=Stenotrophomonas maltophilia TaxID=40324 RepID=UPI001C658635